MHVRSPIEAVLETTSVEVGHVTRQFEQNEGKDLEKGVDDVVET